MDELQKLIESYLEKLEEDKQDLFIDIIDSALDVEDELTEEFIEKMFNAVINEEVEITSEYIKKANDMMNGVPAEGEPSDLHKKFNEMPKKDHDDNEETDNSNTKIPNSDGGVSVDSFTKKLNDKAKEKIKDDKAMKVKESYDFSEDISKIFEGEEFSEELKEKAETVLNAVLKSKLEEESESIVLGILSTLSELAEEELTSFVSKLEEKMEDRMDALAESFVEEYEVEIKNNLKVELAESILSGVKNLLIENNIEVPEGKTDLFENVLTENEELNEMLNEEMDKVSSLKKELSTLKSKSIIITLSEGMTDLEIEKFAKLSESVEWKGDEDYKSKLELIKDTYFKTAKKPALSETDETPFDDKVDLSEDVKASLDSLKKIIG